jgi:hypothetical protein
VIKSRDGETARVMARRVLEELDKGWARRHPPPPPAVTEPGKESSVGGVGGKNRKR